MNKKTFMKVKFRGSARSLLIVAAFMIAGLGMLTNQVHAQNVQDNIAQHTRESIMQKMKSYLPMDSSEGYLDDDLAYESLPNIVTPMSSGELKDKYILDGINAVNLVRYISGLPDDIQPDWPSRYQQQAAALLNATGSFSHNPSRPTDMNQGLYQSGYSGTSESNIAYGDRSLYFSVVDSYMSDSDPSNVAKVGHRRWILNPSMQKTMFGAVYKQTDYGKEVYSNMRSFDKSRTEKVDYDYVAWPSANLFPLEVWSARDPWSVSLNPEKYNSNRMQNIEVKLVRESDGNTWNFSQADKDVNGKFFSVDNQGYGVPFNIVFRPDGTGIYKEEERFRVEINGLYTTEEEPTSITYETIFFKAAPKVNMYANVLHMTVGEKVQLVYEPGGPKYSPIPLMIESWAAPVATMNTDGTITAKKAGVTRFNIRNGLELAQVDLFVDDVTSNNQVSMWAKPSFEHLRAYGLLEMYFKDNHARPVSRLQIAQLSLNLYKLATGALTEYGLPNLFTDTSSSNVKQAVKFGLMKGTSATTFSPEIGLTRQEAAVILMNVYRQSGLGNQTAAGANLQIPAFADAAKIASWAKSDVSEAVRLGFIQGTGKGDFGPREKLTAEQAYVMFGKLLDKIDLSK
ncbi:S-layer homology domain-containing protein [Saccharibacillus qingshengii]|uniref:S-layer homology domain-containing protein n=1 Tax=Saccharibacillus qingshengii TaxID=1763540 RepID=UPI001556CD78|nr:S-layer homology domain-containing protein [Saccharibacillus qingshengii]